MILGYGPVIQICEQDQTLGRQQSFYPFLYISLHPVVHRSQRDLGKWGEGEGALKTCPSYSSSTYKTFFPRTAGTLLSEVILTSELLLGRSLPFSWYNSGQQLGVFFLYCLPIHKPKRVKLSLTTIYHI